MSLEMWERRFAEAGEAYVFGEAPNHFLEASAGLIVPASRVLSVADGEGRNSVWLARQGHCVEAVDFSPSAIAKARRLAARTEVEVSFEHADLFTWTWPRQRYDAVVAIFIQFADPARRGPLFRNMIEALKPGGRLLLHGYTPKQLEYATGGPSAVENLYSEALLSEAFAGLEIESLVAYEQVIHEGRGHDGLSALIDLVARRPA